MKDLTLGAKIKEARIAKKLTQSEVVGNFITRNMLSKIENGSATPSVKTLEYLSHVLEVPLSYFMSSLVSRPGALESAPDDIASQKRNLINALKEKRDVDPLSIEEEYIELANSQTEDHEFCRAMADYWLAHNNTAKAIFYIDYLRARDALLQRECGGKA